MAFIKIRSYKRTDEHKEETRPHMETIEPKKTGQKKITFKAGGLHQSTGTPMGQKIPAAKKAKALAGGFGPKARKQAMFAKNVLVGRH